MSLELVTKIASDSSPSQRMGRRRPRDRTRFHFRTSICTLSKASCA